MFSDIMRRPDDGRPELIFEGMNALQVAFVRDYMLLNKRNNEALLYRSQAGAHLTEFDEVRGCARITMFGDNRTGFLRVCEANLGIDLLTRSAYMNKYPARL